MVGVTAVVRVPMFENPYYKYLRISSHLTENKGILHYKDQPHTSVY